MCDIVKTRCRLSVDRKTSKHVNLKTCKPQNIRSIFERLLKNKPQNVRSTFERLLGSKNEENVFVYFVRQKVYKKFIIRSTFERLLESIKKRRRFRVLRTTKGVLKMYKRRTKNAQKD